MKSNIYEQITAKIVAELEKGVIPWQKPWNTPGVPAHNYVSGKAYSFINQLLILMQGGGTEFLSWNQIQSKGGKVKKGSKSRSIIFSKEFDNVYYVEDEEGNKEEKHLTTYMLRWYNVYNIEDVEGIDSKLEPMKLNEFDPIEKAEEVIKAYAQKYNVQVENTEISSKAYELGGKLVKLPIKGQFRSIEEYYSTAFHELTHSTGTAERLDREEYKKYHSSKKYRAAEELVAEIGAAMSCAKLGINSEKAFKNSASYLQGWLEVFKDPDNARLIVSQSAKAQKAVEMIFNEI